MSVKIKQRTLKSEDVATAAESGGGGGRVDRRLKKKPLPPRTASCQGRLRWENIEMAAMAVAENEVESDDENVSSMPIYRVTLVV